MSSKYYIFPEYVCNRLRIHTFLEECGIKHIRTECDPDYPNRTIWIYKGSQELADALNRYAFARCWDTQFVLAV